jgi:hypothetical protein
MEQQFLYQLQFEPLLAGHMEIFNKTILVRLQFYTQTAIFAHLSLFSLISFTQHRLLFVLQLTANRRSSSS